MSSILSKASWLAAKFCELLIWPVQGLSPAWGLALVSIVVGILLLLAYSKLSNQKKIAAAKRSIFASLLEAVLFRHDLRLSLAAQARMLGWGFRYFLLAVPAILVLAIPCIMIMAELNLHYGLRPFASGEKALISLELNDRTGIQAVTLKAPEGVQVSPPLRVPSENLVQFAVRNLKAGPSQISLQLGSFELQKSIYSEVREGALPAFNYKNFWKLLIYPSADFSNLPPQVRSLTVQYPNQDISIFGMHINWLWAFLLISIGSALIFSKVLGIEV